MSENGIEEPVREEIVKQIGSFALYGFPESHAASFALLAYASAYIRAHHPSCFLCAMLNNHPLGFYSPATLVKDAQRHGVRVLPIDVQSSDWLCHLTEDSAVRLGFRYVDGLRQEAWIRIAAEPPSARWPSSRGSSQGEVRRPRQRQHCSLQAFQARI